MLIAALGSDDRTATEQLSAAAWGKPLRTLRAGVCSAAAPLAGKSELSHFFKATPKTLEPGSEN